ncbi:hypothetical protein QOZ80_5BG0450120 [Eleusine coracana subsp. coracana]|nr:hypothetical protein QOZ80_5BG0450120 [Eleusine coracana subsp. coracana]
MAAAASATGGETRLLDRCIDVAARSAATVEVWRRQRRSLERLPAQLADALLRRLAARGLLFPSLLEVFQRSVEEVDLSGLAAVDAEWLAYLGSFRYLRVLKLADCKNITNPAVWALSGMNTLKELDLSRCSKISDAGIKHIVTIESLEKLHLSETGLTDNGVMAISSLTNLHLLDLGGIQMTDNALRSLRVLTRLEYLDIWGSTVPNLMSLSLADTKIDDSALPYISMMPLLRTVDLSSTCIEGFAHTDVTVEKKLSMSEFENLRYLESLNLEGIPLSAEVIPPLASITALKFLYLRSDFLSDPALHSLSSASNLDLNANHVGTSQLHKPRKSQVSKAKVANSLAGPSRLLGFSIVDERIKYTKEELLELQHLVESNLAMHAVRLPPELQRTT